MKAALAEGGDVNCQGTHRYFVAETGIVEADAKVIVVLVCTACGEGKLHEFTVSNTPYLLKKDKE